VVKVFSEYMDEVREYTYKKKPDYEALAEILLGLKVPVPAKKKAAAPATKKAAAPATKKAAAPATKKTAAPATKKTAASTQRKTSATGRQAAASAGTKRMTRSQATGSSTEESPAKMPRDDTCMEVEYIADSDEDSFADAQDDAGFLDHRDDDSFVTANATPMEWEMVDDENQEPIADSKPKAFVGVTVVIENGPHKGQAINLIQGHSESFVVGRNPTTKGGEAALALPDDADVDDSHIRLDLSVSKKLIGLNVTDLKSSSGSFVGSEKIRKGKDYRIFRGGSVRIGETVLTVKTLDPSKVAFANKESRPSGNKRTGRRQDVSCPASEEPEATPDVELPRLKRRGVRLEVTEGPHKGESFELEHGGTETFIVGSKPSSRTGGLLCLNKDASLKATHMHLDLVVSKKLTTVTVTDKSKGGTVVNRDVVNKGRAFINDSIKIGSSVLEIKSL
jgi:hypothetical protein